MSVDIAVVNTALKWKKIKLLIGKIVIENEETENNIQDENKIKQKYWHECLHCNHWHSTEMK